MLLFSKRVITHQIGAVSISDVPLSVASLTLSTSAAMFFSFTCFSSRLEKSRASVEITDMPCKTATTNTEKSVSDEVSTLDFREMEVRYGKKESVN